MKDIMYPTIKKQFDKLTPEWNSNYDCYEFIDDEGNSHLRYYEHEPGIYVSIEFFYLNYFGMTKEALYNDNSDFANIFIDLVKQSLGSEFEPVRKMGYRNVTFLYNKNIL